MSNESDSYNPTKITSRDHEDLVHTLNQLKVNFHTVQEECTKLKTRNSHLENLVTQLHTDLRAQKHEIQKIYSGKEATPKFLQ